MPRLGESVAVGAGGEEVVDHLGLAGAPAAGGGGGVQRSEPILWWYGRMGEEAGTGSQGRIRKASSPEDACVACTEPQGREKAPPGAS